MTLVKPGSLQDLCTSNKPEERITINLDFPQEELVKTCHEKITTTKALLDLHEHLAALGREVMAKKNSDYANPEASADPFRNFRAFGAYGILVRLSDKLARLRTYLEKAREGHEMAVKDEKWEDTLVDAINYLVLLDGYIRTHGPKD